MITNYYWDVDTSMKHVRILSEPELNEIKVYKYEEGNLYEAIDRAEKEIYKLKKKKKLIK